MTATPKPGGARVCAAAAIAIACVLFGAEAVHGQAIQSAAPQAGALPALVPLSGRARQGGSAGAPHTPVPRAQARGDPLNPVVQVQGGFAGSARPADRSGLSAPLS